MTEGQRPGSVGGEVMALIVGGVAVFGVEVVGIAGKPRLIPLAPGSSPSLLLSSACDQV